MNASGIFSTMVASFGTQETNVITLDSNTSSSSYEGDDEYATSTDRTTSVAPRVNESEKEQMTTNTANSEVWTTQSFPTSNNTTSHQSLFSGDGEASTFADTTNVAPQIILTSEETYSEDTDTSEATTQASTKLSNSTYQSLFSGDGEVTTSSDTTTQLVPKTDNITTSGINTPHQSTYSGSGMAVTFRNMITDLSFQTTAISTENLNITTTGSEATQVFTEPNVATSNQTAITGDEQTVTSLNVTTDLATKQTTLTKELTFPTTNATIEGSTTKDFAKSPLPTPSQNTTVKEVTNISMTSQGSFTVQTATSSTPNDTTSIPYVPTQFTTVTNFSMNSQPMTTSAFFYSNTASDITQPGSFLSSTAQLGLWIGAPSAFVIAFIICLVLCCRKRKKKKMKLKNVRDLWFVTPEEANVESICMKTADQTWHSSNNLEKTNLSVDVVEPAEVNVFAMDNEGYTKSPKKHLTRHSTKTSTSSKGLHHSFKSTSTDATSMFKTSKIKKPHSQMGSPSFAQNIYEGYKRSGSTLDEITDFAEDDNSSTSSVFTDSLNSPKMSTFMAIQETTEKSMPTVSTPFLKNTDSKNQVTTSEKTPPPIIQSPTSKVTTFKNGDKVTNVPDLSTKKQYLN